MLKIEHLKKQFDGQAVLRDVSLEVNTGDVITILGPSGSGKTTLLRCLNFLEQADSGAIGVDGALLPLSGTEDQIRKNRLQFGLVFQNFNLFPQYTALQNITLAPSLLQKGSICR